jgi:raffinose/stachyose/melibiose transport system permease protein
MMARVHRWWIGGLAIFVSIFVFLVPFAFIILMAIKDRKEASMRKLSLPQNGFYLWDNLVAVIETRNYMVVTAFINSIVLTVASVTLLVIFGAMVGYVVQRRPSRWTPVVNFLILAGLIIPPAVVPTIWVMQSIGLFKTLHGMILIEVAYGLSFTVLLFRAFVATVPRELDEAAIVDGAGPVRLFFQIVLPLLKPVVVTVIVVQAVAIFNDFTFPLYYLPGNNNATVQLTLYNFQSQFSTQYNLLFMNILLITIPPLLMYLFFNRQIVAGMTAGAVKG